jgi:hypothetical protein
MDTNETPRPVDETGAEDVLFHPPLSVDDWLTPLPSVN